MGAHFDARIAAYYVSAARTGENISPRMEQVRAMSELADQEVVANICLRAKTDVEKKSHNSKRVSYKNLESSDWEPNEVAWCCESDITKLLLPPTAARCMIRKPSTERCRYSKMSMRRVSVAVAPLGPCRCTCPT